MCYSLRRKSATHWLFSLAEQRAGLVCSAFFREEFSHIPFPASFLLELYLVSFSSQGTLYFGELSFMELVLLLVETICVA